MSKAQQVRAMIAQAKEAGVTQAFVVTKVIAELNMKAGLARAYVANNWDEGTKTVRVVKATKAKVIVAVQEDNEPVMSDAELAAYFEANMQETTPQRRAELRTHRA